MTKPMANPRSAKSNAQMCVVSIDFTEYLLPLTKGLALVELMQHAKKCDSSYRHSGLQKTILTDDTIPTIELDVVSAGQIKAKPPETDVNSY